MRDSGAIDARRRKKHKTRDEQDMNAWSHIFAYPTAITRVNGHAHTKSWAASLSMAAGCAMFDGTEDEM